MPETPQRNRLDPPVEVLSVDLRFTPYPSDLKIGQPLTPHDRLRPFFTSLGEAQNRDYLEEIKRGVKNLKFQRVDKIDK